jgi:amino acid adenylation domain-containing protein
VTAPKDAAVLAESVVDALSQVVAANRARVALVGEDAELTYGDLWQRSGAVARLLDGRTRESTPHVAIFMEQGIDAIVALIGVVRAGLAYVALEPTEPLGRLRFICEDAQATVLLTNVRNAETAAGISPDLTIIDVADATAEAVTVPNVVIDGHEELFVVYTSGSTGQPKGVIRNHRNEIRYGASFGDRLGIRPGSRLSMLFSLSFGASDTDIYGGLLAGATLCLYDTRRLGVVGLPEWIARQEISVLHAVPTVFRFLTDHAPEGGYPSVQAIDLAGEPVFRSDVRRARESFGKNTLLVNRYAATEITVLGQYVATAADEIGDGSLPAGRSPDWVDVLIVDEDGAELPPDSVGHVVVRSSYLSPGYWRRPEMTARTFVDDPSEPRMRRYLSGDAGRRDANGVLTVLGRLDSRVKIRGQSIEPAEVEAALSNLPGVREAIIDVESIGAGADTELRLVGYVVRSAVGDGEMSVDGRSLRSALADRLPPHMLPARIRVVDSFPMLRSGKIDRLALRQLPADEPAAEPPQTDVEKTVAQIYSRILGVAVTSRTDDFFALGGTSLTLAQLQSAVRKELGRELDPAQVVRSATVADVAGSIGRARPAVASPLIVTLREEGTLPPLFLIHGRLGQALVSPSFIKAVPQGHPTYSVQARGLIEGGKPSRSVPHMAGDYLDAISAVANPKRPVLIGVCAGGVIAIEMARQARERGLGTLPIIMLDPPYPPYRRPLTLRIRNVAAYYLALGMPLLGVSRVIAWRVARSLKNRAENTAAIDEVAELDTDAAMRVALSTAIALRRHHPRQFSGSVQVIASEVRMSRGISDAWRSEMTGAVDVIDAGEGHTEALNPSNPRFRAALASALDAAARTIAADQTTVTTVAADVSPMQEISAG